MTPQSDIRFKQTLSEILSAYGKRLSGLGVTPRKLCAEMCDDLSNEGFSFAWTEFYVYAGLENQFIVDSGLTKCKKNEATHHLFIGEKSDNGSFIAGKYRHFWLCSK